MAAACSIWVVSIYFSDHGSDGGDQSMATLGGGSYVDYAIHKDAEDTGRPEVHFLLCGQVVIASEPLPQPAVCILTALDA